MRRFVIWVVILLASVGLGQTATATAPTSAPGGTIRAFANPADEVPTPGFHKLVYEWTDAGGRPQRLPFSVFLPRGYSAQQKWPMVTFLGGLGDRGADPGIEMSVGVPLEVGRDTELRAWMPMIVLSPQCPSDKVWETAGFAADVIRLTRAVAESYCADPARLYVTGFSNGGRGAWVLAAEAPDMFAAIVPIVSREHFPEDTANRLAGSGTTCLVISGTKDPKSEPASANMVAAMKAKNVDVVYAPVPEAQHFIWTAFYRQKEFYEFLLAHRKGQPAPSARLSGEQVVGLYTSRKQETLEEIVFDHRLQNGLDRFEPYWFIDNCARAGRPGLYPNLLGRANVYVTVPLSADIPCRLQTTRQLPADKYTDLLVTVGHQPKTEWELVVRVNEVEKTRKVVNDQTAPTGWTDVGVDLHVLSGQEARLQLIHQATTQPTAPALWGQVKLKESPR